MDHRDDRPATAAPLVDPQQSAWSAFATAASPDAFYRSWLALQCRQIHGVQTAVLVLRAPGGRFAPAAVWPEGGRNAEHLGEVSERALSEQRGLVIPRAPRRHSDGTSRPRYDVAYPIQVDGAVHGVVALDVVPRQQRDLESLLRQLQWGAAWLELSVLRHDHASLSAMRARLQTVVELLATAFGHARFVEAATAFATAVATKLACDRVSVGFIASGRARVRAMSHTAQFGKQTNVVRAIESAMDEAIDQAAVVAAPATPSDTPRVSRMHVELSRQHGSPSVCTAPFAYGGEIIGALTLERPAPFDEEAQHLAEALAGLAGPVLELTRREDRALAAKAADAARDAIGAVIGPRHLSVKLAVVAAALAIGVLATAKGEMRVSGTATLEPIVRRAAVAPFAGFIAEAPARAGDVVRRGQLLARLDDRDLRLERLKWASQQEQLTRQYGQALATRNAPQVMILSAQVDQARAQVALLDDQLARTRIESPFDGIVVTGDLAQSLASPVERGQVLFEIAPLDAYRLAVQVDERDVAMVAPAQHGTLVLAGAPGNHVAFTIEKVTPVSTAKESRNYFRVEAKLDRAPERVRPGMEGIGKIDVGRQLWIWIWTRQIIDWARLQLWTWLP